MQQKFTVSSGCALVAMTSKEAVLLGSIYFECAANQTESVYCCLLLLCCCGVGAKLLPDNNLWVTKVYMPDTQPGCQTWLLLSVYRALLESERFADQC